MFKLVRREIIVNLSKKWPNLLFILLILPTMALFLEGNSVYLLIFHIPALITLYVSISMDIEEIKLNHNAFIQSLPVKRWEYVVSKYIISTINYIFVVIYTIILMKILSYLGYNHLEFINLNAIKEAAIISFYTFSILLPISFIFFSRWRIFFGILILSILAQSYNYDKYGGSLNTLIQILKKKTNPIIFIITLFFSIGISIVAYKKRDLV